LFEQSGSWLADQGRDPLFLWLMRFAAAAFGSDGYADFRFALAIYFVAFTWLLCSGRVLPFVAGPPHLFPLLVALLLFAGTRFTIQIREGLAMTLVLCAIAQVWDARPRGQHPFRALALLIVATLVHGGVVLLAAAFALAWIVARPGAAQGRRKAPRPWAQTALVALLAGGLATTIALGTDAGSRFVYALAEGRAEAEGATAAKFAFWGLIGACSAVIAAGAMRTVSTPGTPPVLRVFVRILASFALPAIFGAVLAELAANASAVLISGTARSMQMITGLLVLLLAWRRAFTWPIALAALTLLADQVRVIVEAVLGLIELLPS